MVPSGSLLTGHNTLNIKTKPQRRSMNSKKTQYTFIAGAVYFAAMAVAHYFGLKVPGLFVYYDTPSYDYQDKIISFAVCAYTVLFYSAARHRVVAPSAIIVLALTVLGLSSVNLSCALYVVLEAGKSTVAYWIQTGVIAVYLLILIIFYLSDSKVLKSEES